MPHKKNLPKCPRAVRQIFRIWSYPFLNVDHKIHDLTLIKHLTTNLTYPTINCISRTHREHFSLIANKFYVGYDESNI